MGIPPSWQGESSKENLSLVPSPFIWRNILGTRLGESLGMRPGELGNEARRKQSGNEARRNSLGMRLGEPGNEARRARE